MLLPARYAASVARCGFLGLVAAAAFMLVAHYETAFPRPYPPGIARRIGSQAWDVAFRADSQQTVVDSAVNHAESSSNSGSSTSTGIVYDYDEGDDDDLGFLRDTWDPFVADSTPITELKFKTCVLPPGLYDMCSPTSSKLEDATRGEWKRVDKDLNKRIGIYYAYLYYRRLLPGSSSPIITNITIMDRENAQDEFDSGNGIWNQVPESIRTGVWPRLKPMYLYYQSTSQHLVSAARSKSSDGNAGPQLEPITELDIIYGGDEVKPLPGFTRIPTKITGGDDDEKAAGVSGGKGTRVGSSLAYRKVPRKVVPTAPPLRFSSEGNFTILQVADLHLSVGPGECRDLDAKQRAQCQTLGADRYSLEWLDTALETVKPSLVVLSGDQLNGQDTSWSLQSVVMKWAPLIYERAIPWAVVFGNHDGEKTDLPLEQQMRFMQQLPYFVGEIGPSSIAGVGNYVRSIRANDSDTVLTTLYFLDSHANAKKSTPWSTPGYDYIKADQINWFRGRSSQIHTLRRPYTPKVTKPTGSNARPGRPKKPARPAKGNAAYMPSGFGGGMAPRRERRRVEVLERRQVGDDDLPGEDESLDSINDPISSDDAMEDLAKAIDAEEKKIEAELNDIAVSDKQDDDQTISVGFGQMPDDGSNIKEVPTGDEADEFVGGNPLLSTPPEDLEPTVLPAGPTRANPMDAKPNALVFFHIPLQASYNSPLDVGANGSYLSFGERLEGEGASKTDSGFFHQGILAQKEMLAESSGPIDPFWDGESSSPTTGRPEVKVIANGHCHISADCSRVAGVWLCFGGGATYSGYGKAGFPRRMRVYQLSDYGETIETYHLLDTKQQVDRVVLVRENALGSS